MVSTQDSESCDPSSNLGRTSFLGIKSKVAEVGEYLAILADVELVGDELADERLAMVVAFQDVSLVAACIVFDISAYSVQELPRHLALLPLLPTTLLPLCRGVASQQRPVNWQLGFELLDLTRLDHRVPSLLLHYFAGHEAFLLETGVADRVFLEDQVTFARREQVVVALLSSEPSL